MPSNRGMVLQQHFNLGFIDEKDIRYKLPIDNLLGLTADQLVPPQLSPAGETSKPNIPNERELKGRSKTWENLVYVLPLLLSRGVIDVARFLGVV
jgi:hypothetical protein